VLLTTPRHTRRTARARAAAPPPRAGRIDANGALLERVASKLDQVVEASRREPQQAD
jgi:hypothetical protein